MGRTEADRKITSEPWLSMQRRKKTEKNEREKLFSVTRGSVLKKSLTGPTLLEMSGGNLASLQEYRKLVLDVVESSSPAGILFD